MGSRSQNPRGTRVPAKKSVDPVKTPKKPHPKSKVSALLDFFSDLKHTYCRHYFGSISTLLQLFRKFKFLTSNHFVIPFKWAAAKKSVCSLRLNGRKGIQPLVTYDKVFCHEKLYSLTFKSTKYLTLSVYDVLVGFSHSKKRIIPVFLAIKVMQFDLTKNNMAELNNEHLEKNLISQQRETVNALLQTAVCGFPWET